MTSGERWLAALWPVVRPRLPEPPARVVDLGCGALGGFVPLLESEGYEPLGVDPDAPAGANYRRVEFERLEAREQFEAAIASTSLHHVSDPAEVIDRLASALTAGGTLVVVEWASESFDEATARWCFERLPDEENWLHRRRDEWSASGTSWTRYLDDWVTGDGIHRGELLLGLLDERFERRHLAYGPYFFPDLACTEADEQTAIDAGRIRATRIDWVGACTP